MTHRQISVIVVVRGVGLVILPPGEITYRRRVGRTESWEDVENILTTA
ncbi:MAG: hypothetical protein WCT32_04380 [Patescibacteria group bacterium]